MSAPRPPRPGLRPTTWRAQLRRRPCSCSIRPPASDLRRRPARPRRARRLSQRRRPQLRGRRRHGGLPAAGDTLDPQRSLPNLDGAVVLGSPPGPTPRRRPARCAARPRSVRAAARSRPPTTRRSRSGPTASTIARAHCLPGRDPRSPGGSFPASSASSSCRGPARATGRRRPTAATLRAVADHLARAVGVVGAEVVRRAPLPRDRRAGGPRSRAPAATSPPLASAARDTIDRWLDPLRGGDDGTGWPFGAPVRCGRAHASAARRLPELVAVSPLSFRIDGRRLAACADVPLDGRADVARLPPWRSSPRRGRQVTPERRPARRSACSTTASAGTRRGRTVSGDVLVEGGALSSPAAPAGRRSAWRRRGSPGCGPAARGGSATGRRISAARRRATTTFVVLAGRRQRARARRPRAARRGRRGRRRRALDGPGERLVGAAHAAGRDRRGLDAAARLLVGDDHGTLHELDLSGLPCAAGAPTPARRCAPSPRTTARRAGRSSVHDDGGDARGGDRVTAGAPRRWPGCRHGVRPSTEQGFCLGRARLLRLGRPAAATDDLGPGPVALRHARRVPDRTARQRHPALPLAPRPTRRRRPRGHLVSRGRDDRRTDRRPRRAAAAAAVERVPAGDPHPTTGSTRGPA